MFASAAFVLGFTIYNFFSHALRFFEDDVKEIRAWQPKQRVEDNAFHYTRERRRPALREYFIGRRFGSILSIPAPLFTSMIWSRNNAARSNSRFAEACCISSSSSRSNSVRLKSPPASRITDDSISRPRKIVCRLSCTARRTVCGVIPYFSLYSICLARRYSEIDMSASIL